MRPGEVITETWGLYRAHWRHLIAIAAVVYLLISALVIALAFVIGVLAAFISLAGVFWLQGVLARAVEDLRDGRADLSPRETIAAALPKINVLSAAGILASVAIGLGLALFIVPGLILLTIWSMIAPAIVLEGASVFGAFRRSQQLVRGNGWNVAGVIVITVALLIGAGLVLALVLQGIDPEWLESVVVNVISNTVFAPFAAVAWTIMYFRLRTLEQTR